jgi:hypothetical protein
MSGWSGIVVGMANQKEYPGYPRLYKKGDLVRQASTPKDGVNLEHRGYTHVKDVDELAPEKAADVETKTENAGADAASAVSGSAQAPVTDSKPRPQGNNRPLAH